MRLSGSTAWQRLKIRSASVAAVTERESEMANENFWTVAGLFEPEPEDLNTFYDKLAGAELEAWGRSKCLTNTVTAVRCCEGKVRMIFINGIKYNPGL